MNRDPTSERSRQPSDGAPGEELRPETPTQPDGISPTEVDWNRVRRTTFLVHQRFRYEYPAPIRDLQHRLIVIPPVELGSQRRISYQLDVSEPAADIATRTDSFANTVIEVRVPVVERAIEFDVSVQVERSVPAAPRFLPASWLDDPRLLSPSARTTPDDALKRAAAELSGHGSYGLELAALVNAWVYDTMEYRSGVTGIHTTAAQALGAGGGVCQDYSHVMVSICRLLGLPSLYVSGHLLGEGGTHAWVEVLLPAADGSGRTEAWQFDPTHRRQAGMAYVTVAVGRDYGDVAPASGNYRAEHRGNLAAEKRVLLTEVSYTD